MAGDGAGPRCMIPRIKNFIIAGYDQVAVDTVAAKMMGFDPLKLPFIKLASDDGLGCADLDEIELIGDDISQRKLAFPCFPQPCGVGGSTSPEKAN